MQTAIRPGAASRPSSGEPVGAAATGIRRQRGALGPRAPAPAIATSVAGGGRPARRAQKRRPRAARAGARPRRRDDRGRRRAPSKRRPPTNSRRVGRAPRRERRRQRGLEVRSAHERGNLSSGAMPAGTTRAFLADARAQLGAGAGARARRGPAGAEPAPAPTWTLLKLRLCDLAGASTLSVGAMPDGTVMSRELRGADRRMRAAGLDWPLQGLTMVGLGRLDDLQACVESVVADGRRGRPDRGRRLARRRVAADARHARHARRRRARSGSPTRSPGFPADERAEAGEPALSAYDFLAAPLEEVRDSFARLGLDGGVEFVPGLLRARRCRRWPAGAGRSSGSTPTPTSRPASRSTASTPASRPAATWSSTTTARSRAAAGRSTSSAPSTGSPSRSSRSTPPARAGGASRGRRWRSTPPDPVAPRAVAARPRPARPDGARRSSSPARRRTCARRLEAAEAAVGLRPWLRRRLERAMIVFGCSITDPDMYRHARGARASASPPSRTPRCSPTPPPARSSAPTT